MGTHNGADLIQEQLRSIVAQTHQEWTLHISDDGSTDGTRDVVAAFQKANPSADIRVSSGPCTGHAANFLSLAAQPGLAGQWIAFCDQDDVWMPHKLARAVAQMGEHSTTVYVSTTLRTRRDLSGPKLASAVPPRPLGFANAMVQNVLAGNTIVLAPPATDVLRKTVPAAMNHRVKFHDWWIYLVMTGAGQPITYDAKPGLYYRQHGDNAMGNSGLNKGARIKSLMSGEFGDWMGRNISALFESATLTPENKDILDAMIAWRKGDVRFSDLPIYRQTALGNVALRLAARAGKLTSE